MPSLQTVAGSNIAAAAQFVAGSFCGYKGTKVNLWTIERSDAAETVNLLVLQ